MHKRNFCLTFCGLGLVMALLLPMVTAQQAEALSPAAIAAVQPAEKHKNLDQTIAGLLSHYHYRQHKLNDALASAILDAYLEALDYNRSFFLASDIVTFNRYRTLLDDYLQAGNLDPAYEIFNIYQQRLAERTARLQIQLERPFNFEINETLELDRKDAPWATSKAELDEIWRKRLKNELLLLILEGKDMAEAKDTLLRRYDGRLRRTAQSNSEDVFQIYMNAVARSFDPHTAYFSPRTSENFNIQMRLSLEGIGTVLRMDEEQITVVELVPGGPADLSKQLQPNDKIVGVGQGPNGPLVDVVGWRLDDVVDLIRGPRQTVVRLQVVPAKAGPNTPNKIVQLVRDTIKLEKQAAKSEVRTITGKNGNVKVGIITLPTFYSDFAAAQRGDAEYRSTTRDVRRLLDELKKEHIDSLIIDLRQNGGGSLQEAVELTGLFIKDGPVVQVRNAKGNIEVETDPDPDQIYDGPMAVLVNRYSASASEIFAGAMQDYGRALIIGSPTFGKGTVQTLIDLDRFLPNAKNQLGQLKLTIAKFYRVSGSSTQHRGVLPDIDFPSLLDDEEAGESAQDHALPWDEIKPVNFQGNTALTGLVAELNRRHTARMRFNHDYRQLLDDIAEAKRLREKTVVSLLRSEREAERTREEARQLVRENERRQKLGLPLLKNGDEIPEVAEEDLPDLMLDESTHIVADLTELAGSQGSRMVMTN